MSILKTELFARIPNGNPEQVKKFIEVVRKHKR